MLSVSQFGRLLHITRIFVRHDLDEFVRAIHLFRPYLALLRLLPWYWWSRVVAPRRAGTRECRERAGARSGRGQRLREALEELGPIFVKFGQVLSTRPDLLPDDIAEELAKLQDQVPPFPEAEAVAIVERVLGGTLTQFFSDFSHTPLASASVAQVHVARLRDGAEVVVKVLRPGIEPVIERDVQLLYVLARLAVRYAPAARRLRPVEVVDEFRRTLQDELDLRVESANASRLRANFADSKLLYVPRVYWDLTRREVMVMERIHGIPVSQVDGLKAAGIDMKQLAHHGVEIFFTQAFRDGFFHADMHPGNIFVYPDGRYCAVDFGIMGSLGEKDKRYLAENFLAFFNRDYRAVAEAHLRAGWVPPGTRIGEFESAIRAVLEPAFAKPLSEISFGRLLLHLFQTARRFNMEIQPQLVLLQKTLFNIEGLGRRLYPQLDLWETAKPFLENWMRQHMGPRAFFKTLRRELPTWWAMAPELPGLVHEALRRLKGGELSMEWKSRELEQLRRELRDYRQRTTLMLIGGGALVAGMLDALLRWTPARVFGGLLAAAGIILLVRALMPTDRDT